MKIEQYLRPPLSPYYRGIKMFSMIEELLMNNFFIENKRRWHLPLYFERGRFSLFFTLIDGSYK